MSATKKLRRLLDERGVKWRMTPHYSSESNDNETLFDGNGLEWYAREFSDDYVELRTARLIVTPEQAVEATVGRETCHMTLYAAGNDYARYACSECERETMVPRVVEGVSRDYERPRYCVNCGRKVIE